MEISKRQLKCDLNTVFGIASIEMGAGIPSSERTAEVKQNLRWLRDVKREVVDRLGLSQQRRRR